MMQDADRVDEIEAAAPSAGRSGGRRRSPCTTWTLSSAARLRARRLDGSTQVECDDLPGAKTVGEVGVPPGPAAGIEDPLAVEEVPIDRIEPVEELGFELGVELGEVLPLPAERGCGLRAAAARGRAGRASGCRRESPSCVRTPRTRASRTRRRPRPRTRAVSGSAEIGQRSSSTRRGFTQPPQGEGASSDAARRGLSRALLDPAPMPELEDEQRPQLLAVIPAAREVLRQEPLHLRGGEDPLRPEARQERARPGAPRAARS